MKSRDWRIIGKPHYSERNLYSDTDQPKYPGPVNPNRIQRIRIKSQRLLDYQLNQLNIIWYKAGLSGYEADSTDYPTMITRINQDTRKTGIPEVSPTDWF